MLCAGMRAGWCGRHACALLRSLHCGLRLARPVFVIVRVWYPLKCGRRATSLRTIKNLSPTRGGARNGGVCSVPRRAAR